jgi:hypothetical protein
MTQGPASDKEMMAPVNAECVSMCGDRPTPGVYSFTVSWFMVGVPGTACGTAVQAAHSLCLAGTVTEWPVAASDRLEVQERAVAPGHRELKCLAKIHIKLCVASQTCGDMNIQNS